MRQVIRSIWIAVPVIGLFLIFTGCSEDSSTGPEPLDPDTAPRASIDRFSEDAGTLMIRTAENGLPGPDEAINFDQGAPFITKGLGPTGNLVEYYNFDVQSTIPAPIYALFREGESTPVEGQLNIVDVVPGDEGYNDFWHVHKVTVPSDYTTNTVTSLDEIQDAGYEMEATNMLVNCPIVPEGSTAMKRGGDESNSLHMGWYKNKVVTYFTFEEKALTTTGNSMIPLSPIYVTFNINPGMEGGGPPSGFVIESGTMQTHNVPATVPTDAGYSPLWNVNIYDNTDFDAVMDLSTAQNANILATGAATVNCPIVTF